MTERPRLTTDLERCRADLERSGYCLLADALTPAELREAQERLTAQAAAERERGVAYMDGTPGKNWGAFADADGTVQHDRFTVAAGGVSQRLFMLLNKGGIFRDIVLMEHALELAGHVLGSHYQLSCSTANIIGKGAAPMELHTDAWWMPPPVPKGRFGLPVGSITRAEAGEVRDGAAMIAPPAALNSMWLLVDFHDENGATRVVPGSHLSGRQPKTGPVPRGGRGADRGAGRYGDVLRGPAVARLRHQPHRRAAHGPAQHLLRTAVPAAGELHPGPDAGGGRRGPAAPQGAGRLQGLERLRPASTRRPWS